jgi:SRSO17 transposase
MGRLGREACARRFAAYVDDLASVIGHADRERPLRDYCTGLLMPCERKSVECVFRKFPDTDFGNSRTAISVIPGQGFR